LKVHGIYLATNCGHRVLTRRRPVSDIRGSFFGVPPTQTRLYYYCLTARPMQRPRNVRTYVVRGTSCSRLSDCRSYRTMGRRQRAGPSLSCPSDVDLMNEWMMYRPSHSHRRRRVYTHAVRRTGPNLPDITSSYVKAFPLSTR